jgi:vanillate O-demethylase ferredoxin subunit
MIDVEVRQKRNEAVGISSFLLVRASGGALPPFSAGAHIDVHLDDKLIRQYSICNSPGEQHQYLIAVLREASSRGGSAAMHDRIAEGDTLRISEPRNHFPLTSGAHRSILIAGGIGVTPILSMAEHLHRTGAEFEMHYCVRSKERAAFLDRIESSGFAPRVTVHYDDGPDAQRLDLERVLNPAAHDAHLYVCGPQGFMDWALRGAAAAAWPQDRLHREFFAIAAPDGDSLPDRPFTVISGRNGREFSIPAGKSIAQVLGENGIDVPLSCEQGICGTCLTGVLEGEPDHRDMFMTDDEHARNDQITVCCSRAKSTRLVLDL